MSCVLRGHEIDFLRERERERPLATTTMQRRSNIMYYMMCRIPTTLFSCMPREPDQSTVRWSIARICNRFSVTISDGRLDELHEEIRTR